MADVRDVPGSSQSFAWERGGCGFGEGRGCVPKFG